MRFCALITLLMCVFTTALDCDSEFYACQANMSCDTCYALYQCCISGTTTPSSASATPSQAPTNAISNTPTNTATLQSKSPTTILSNTPTNTDNMPSGVSSIVPATTNVGTCGGSWTSINHAVMLNGSPFAIKGVNWFGFETSINILHGLWAVSFSSLLDFIKTNRFNAIRVPFSLAFALQPDAGVSGCDSTLNPDICSKTGWEVMQLLFTEAEKRGVYILLDMHALERDNRNALWYDGIYSESDFIRGWVSILKQFGNNANLMGIDVYNEPHDSATWNTGDSSTDWVQGVKRIMAGIYSEVPDFDKLVFVEGIDYGKTIGNIDNDPLAFLGDKLVYSVHYYGPSVYSQPYFTDSAFPTNLPAVYDAAFGYLLQKTSRALVIGEWGTTYTGQDAVWAEAWVSYLNSRGISNTFFWSLNPNSQDSGGLLQDDWKTPIPEKLSLVAKVQPNPTNCV